MKALIILFIIFLNAIATYIGFSKIIQSVESNEENNIKENFEQMGKINENEIKDSKNSNFYKDTDLICKSDYKKYEDLLKTIDNYVQRYVSLFLITSNLQDYKIKDLNEMISIDLEISITGEDLIYLQGYSKSGKDSFHFKNLSKLDAIFSKIARLKERSFAENAIKSSKSFFASFNYFNIVSSPTFYPFLSLLVTLLITWIIHHYLFHNSFYICFGLTLNVLLFWESLNEYWKKIKEIDIEIYIQNLKGMPEECNYENLRWYHSLWTYFSEDQCVQYYKNISRNSVEEVSLIKCIIDTYSFYLIRTPFKLFGASIRDFTEEIIALWPLYLRYLVYLPFVPFFVILLAISILILLRKRVRLSFFGAAVEIGEAPRITENERPAFTSSEMSKTVRVIRKLRPWTKSRFPKRLHFCTGKQKKPFLRFRSESESPSQDEQNYTDSSEKLINNEVNHD